MEHLRDMGWDNIPATLAVTSISTYSPDAKVRQLTLRVVPVMPEQAWPVSGIQWHPATRE